MCLLSEKEQSGIELESVGVDKEKAGCNLKSGVLKYQNVIE